MVAACGSSDSDDEGSGGGGATDPEEAGAQPPETPADAPASGPGATIAVSELLVGETDWDGNPSLTAWGGFGYNIDGIISTKSGSNHCAPAAGANPAKVKEDGPEGQDNSFGKILIPIIKTFASNPSDEISAAIADGDFTLMVTMENYAAGEANQTGVRAALFGGASLGGAPAWNGSDDWPVFPELLKDSTGTPSVDNSKIQFLSSYVRDNTWVSGSAGTIDLSLSISGYTLALAITQAVVTAELSGDPPSSERGIIAGVIATESLINELKKIAGGLDETLCEGQTFESIASQIRAASDIMSDGTNGDAGQTCNAISIGLGFKAKPVMAPTQVAAPSGPPDDPCAG
jgi:hypothetical protein